MRAADVATQPPRFEWPLVGIPILFVVLALLFGSRHFHWDTLERAYLLEHAGSYLRTWDGSPRSQFLSFAHVLELPMAAVVRMALGGAPGMRALIVFEALAAAGALLLLGRLVCFWGGGRLAALGAQLVLAVTYGFWKMGSSGEERIVALATLLLFLSTYWQALGGGRRAFWVTATLVLATLTHLSAMVLVPFALLALVVVPSQWKPRRREVLGAVIMGAVLTVLLYAGVAAWTTHVRAPSEFVHYLTFFHRESGNDFFRAAPSVSEQVAASASGLLVFFGTPRFVGLAALTILVAAIVAARVRGAGNPRAGAAPAWSYLARHSIVLGVLWALHFTFYEPANVESWTVVATLLVLAASTVPWRGAIAAQGAVAVLLLLANLPAFAALHAPMPLARYHDVVRRDTAPGDIVLLVGGIQNGQPLRGSISMRFFLAHERERTLASLYDLMQITDREYWDRPFASVDALARALASGRRVWFPAFLRPEFDKANQSGRIHLEFEARGDSLYEVVAARR